MQGGRDPFFGFGDPFGSFNGFGGFGGQSSMLSSVSGGRDPFDDPFLTCPEIPCTILPNGGPFMNENFYGFLDHQPFMSFVSMEPLVEELHSDDDTEENESEEKKVNSMKHGRSSKEPVVDYPDDEATEKKSKYMPQKNNMHLLNHEREPQTQTSGSTQRPQNRGGWALPSTERSVNAERLKPENMRGTEWPYLRKSNVNDAIGSSRLGSNGTP